MEVQLEVCRIWAYGAPGAQVDNGQWELWDQICVRHILETTGPIFIIEKAKAIWKPLDPRCALAWSFSLDVPWGLKRALGAQILCSIYVDDHWVDFQDEKNICLWILDTCWFVISLTGPRVPNLLACWPNFQDLLIILLVTQLRDSRACEAIGSLVKCNG